MTSGDRLKGLAFTQFDGTVTWDKAGVYGRVDPANDPLHSLLVWQRQYEGKEPGELPTELRAIFKNSSITNRSAGDLTKLRDHYLSKVCVPTRPTFDPLNSEVARLKKDRTDLDSAITGTFIFRDLDTPRDAFVMVRGQYDKPGDRVVPSMPAALSSAPTVIAGSSDTPPRLTRLDLAHWLVSPSNR